MESAQRDHVIDLIKHSAYEAARHELIEWMAVEEDCAQIHHLLGVICELSHDIDKAKKHYRASYAMDPSYCYSMLNLERLVIGKALQKDSHLYYGNEVLKEH